MAFDLVKRKEAGPCEPCVSRIREGAKARNPKRTFRLVFKILMQGCFSITRVFDQVLLLFLLATNTTQSITSDHLSMKEPLSHTSYRQEKGTVERSVLICSSGGFRMARNLEV